MELIGIEEAARNASHVLELFGARNLPIFHIQHLSNRTGATSFLSSTDDLGFCCLVIPNACETRNLVFGRITIEAYQVHAAFLAALSSPFAQVIEANKIENQLS